MERKGSCIFYNAITFLQFEKSMGSKNQWGHKSMGSQINGVTNQWGHKSMGSQINGVTNQWGHKSMGSDSIDFFIEPFYIAFLGYWDLLYGSSCSFCACSRY